MWINIKIYFVTWLEIFPIVYMPISFYGLGDHGRLGMNDGLVLHERSDNFRKVLAWTDPIG